MIVMLFVKSFMFLLMGMFTLYSGFDNKIYFEFILKNVLVNVMEGCLILFVMMIVVN